MTNDIQSLTAGHRSLVTLKIGGAAGVDLEAVCADVAALVKQGQQVVLVHGGGWMMGHAVMHQRHAAQLAADGFVALTINYRLLQEARWPACLDDAKAAVRSTSSVSVIWFPERPRAASARHR